MKWTPISKAKVKFGQLYLVTNPEMDEPKTGKLYESKETAKGVVHTFDVGDSEVIPVLATHVAIVTDPL